MMLPKTMDNLCSIVVVYFSLESWICPRILSRPTNKREFFLAPVAWGLFAVKCHETRLLLL